MLSHLYIENVCPCQLACCLLLLLWQAWRYLKEGEVTCSLKPQCNCIIKWKPYLCDAAQHYLNDLSLMTRRNFSLIWYGTNHVHVRHALSRFFHRLFRTEFQLKWLLNTKREGMPSLTEFVSKRLLYSEIQKSRHNPTKKLVFLYLNTS